MKPKRIFFGIILVAIIAVASVFSGKFIQRFSDQFGSPGPHGPDGCYFGECETGSRPTNGECSPVISSEGEIEILCGPRLILHYFHADQMGCVPANQQVQSLISAG